MYLQYNLKEDYNRTTAPKRAANYFRYIDKSVEELDQEVNIINHDHYSHLHYTNKVANMTVLQLLMNHLAG